MIIEYSHEPLNQEITAIAGYYVYTKEGRLPFQDREVLYLVGYAVIETSCCGTGGCGFAAVPGFIHSFHEKTAPSGTPVSLVEPIRDPAIQEEITRILQKQEPVTQVQFR
jgi:hypothetical protein